MNTPVQVGLPQIFLIIFVILGVGLLISAFMGLLSGKAEKEIFEDEHGRRYHRWRRRKRRLHWMRGVSGIVVMALAISLLWLSFAVQAYLGLTSDIKAGQIQATKLDNANHSMVVTLTLYNENGQSTAHKTYSLKGDQWMLRANMIKFPTWMNMFGIHSGYKVTWLEGMYEDPNDERNAKHDVIVLNGGDDNFFKSVYKQAWTSPFVDAAYSNAVLEPADGMSYDIYVSQTGLYARPANKP